MDTRGRDHGTRPRFRLAQPGQGTRASRGGLRSRGGLLALLALGLCGATTAGFGQERIRDVVNTPALLLYGGQVRPHCFTSGGMCAVRAGPSIESEPPTDVARDFALDH
jgi:hypothetical protein